MILGNKCDMNDRRQVSKERGEQVNFQGFNFSGIYHFWSAKLYNDK